MEAEGASLPTYPPAVEPAAAPAPLRQNPQGDRGLPIKHSVMVFPNQPPNSSRNDCMNATYTSTAVRPRMTGTVEGMRVSGGQG